MRTGLNINAQVVPFWRIFMVSTTLTGTNSGRESRCTITESLTAISSNGGTMEPKMSCGVEYDFTILHRRDMAPSAFALARSKIENQQK
jgi:hypothetical protein